MQRKMKWFYLQMPQSPSVMMMFISSFLGIIASVLIQAGGYISTAFHSLVCWFKLQTPACHHLKKNKMLPVKNLIQSHHQSNAPSQEFIKSLLFIDLKKPDCSSFHHTHRESIQFQANQTMNQLKNSMLGAANLLFWNLCKTSWPICWTQILMSRNVHPSHLMPNLIECLCDTVFFVLHPAVLELFYMNPDQWVIDTNFWV